MLSTLIAKEDGLYTIFGDRLIKLDPKTAAEALSSQLEEEKTNLIMGLQKAQVGGDLETILKEGLDQITQLNKLLRPLLISHIVANTSPADVAKGIVPGVVINTPPTPVAQKSIEKQASAEANEIVVIAHRQKLARGRRSVLPIDEVSSMGTVAGI